MADDDSAESWPTADPLDPDTAYLRQWDAERSAAPVEWYDPGDRLWTARPVLRHIEAFARASRASPWAVLGVVLARVVAVVPPYVVLPDSGTLNLFVGLVGPSGAGKGTAELAGGKALDMMAEPTIAGIGSGEGLVHLFARRVRNGDHEIHTSNVLLSVPEVDTLEALSRRTGTTLSAELRKAWSGETLGFAYADLPRRLTVPRHRYRMSLVMGIQPARAGALLRPTDIAAGTPQRWLWLPAVDPFAPDQRPPEPLPLPYVGPPWPEQFTPPGGRPHPIVIDVFEPALRYLDNKRLSGLRAQPTTAGGDNLTGQEPLLRLKVAAALAVLDERTSVDREDWHLSGIVAQMSRTTRTRVQEALAAASASENRARALAQADRDEIVAERLAVAAHQRVRRWVLRRLAGSAEGMTWRELARAVAARDRAGLRTVVDELLDAGGITVEVYEAGGREGERYRYDHGL